MSYKNYAAYISIATSQFVGAAFVPLNINFPISRNIEIIKLSGINCLIYDDASAEYFESLNFEANQENLISIKFDDYIIQDPKLKIEIITKFNNATDNNALVQSQSHAYIMFTSGSTGSPKGVPVTYKNLCTFLEYCQLRYNINKTDRVSHTFELTFDLSIFDIFMTLSHGATLIVTSSLELLSPVAIIKNKKISVWFSVPSVAKLAFKKGLLSPNALPNLRLSLFCGEPLFVDLASAWISAAPNSKVENLYGPTELTIACSHFDCKEINRIVNTHIVPIGTVFNHLNYIILKEDMTEAAIGEEGHLYISGGQLFPGYLNDLGKTKKVFINYNNKIYYATGDLVKLIDDILYYIGRVDYQVKINGYRIELLEIEACVKLLNGVTDVVVLDYVDYHTQEKKLALFYSAKLLNKDLIYKHLQSKLPKYMLPSDFIEVESFPLNGNGKTDREELRNSIQSVLIFDDKRDTKLRWC